MAFIHETMPLPQDLVSDVLGFSWVLDLPHISIYRGSAQEPVRQGPGRITQDAQTGFLWLEITAHSRGIIERVSDLNEHKAGTLIGEERLLRMVGSETSGVEWRSEGFIENECDCGFHGGLAVYRYRLDSVWRGAREPNELIRECIVIFDGHLPIPMSHTTHVTVTDGQNGNQSSHSLRNRLHFDSAEWSRQIIHRLAGYTECIVSLKKNGLSGHGLRPYVEEVVVQSLTAAFKILCDWRICYYSTADGQTLVVKSLAPQVPWRSAFPVINVPSLYMGCAESLLTKWFDSIGGSFESEGWDMRARVVYSVLKNENALAEVPTQLLVLGAGIETVARKYFEARGFDAKPALAELACVVDGVKQGKIEGVSAAFGERLSGFKDFMSGPSTKDLFRLSNSGNHLDFSASEIQGWGKGRNLSAHGKWPGPTDGVPYLYSMITMLNKALLRTIDWSMPLTDYAAQGWPLVNPKDETQKPETG